MVKRNNSGIAERGRFSGKKAAFVMMLAMVCMFVSGCGEKEKEKVSLTVKVPTITMQCVTDESIEESSQFLQKAWDSFAQQYEKYDVDMDLIVFEQTSYKKAIQDCYGTQEAADILYGGYFAISGYIYDGYAIPLDDIITEEIKADFSESTWMLSQGYNGKTYLMPFMALQNILCYNKEIFRQCGLEEYISDEEEIQGWSLEQWDEVFSVLAEELPANHYPMMMYAKNNQGDTHTMIQLRCKGSSFFDDEGLFHLNTPEGIAGLSWLLDNYNKHYYPQNCEDLEISDCTELFVQGQLAIQVYNTSLEAYFEGLELGYVNFPGVNDSGVNSSWITGFMAFDNGDAKKMEVAKDFIRYIYETPEMLDYSAGGIPCSTSVMERHGDKIPMAEQFHENEVNSVDFTANNPNWAEVREAFWPHINALLSGYETPAECAAGIDADCNAAINSGVRRLHE